MEGALLGPESSPEAFLDQGKKGRFILNHQGEAILFDRAALALLGADPAQLLGSRFDVASAEPSRLTQEGRTTDAVLYRVRDPRPFRDAEVGLGRLEADARALAERAGTAAASAEKLRALLRTAESGPEPRAFLGAVGFVARELFPDAGSVTTPYGTEQWGDPDGLGVARSVGHGVTLAFAEPGANGAPSTAELLGIIVAIGLDS